VKCKLIFRAVAFLSFVSCAHGQRESSIIAKHLGTSQHDAASYTYAGVLLGDCSFELVS
jgi:hypothetical protein